MTYPTDGGGAVGKSTAGALFKVGDYVHLPPEWDDIWAPGARGVITKAQEYPLGGFFYRVRSERLRHLAVFDENELEARRE